ncbi:MAG: ASPIC/UnbV domain-containing protein [Actinomycetota bacterium]
MERSAELGVDDGGWGWGAVDVDLNHDGWLDLVETNGWSLPSYENEPSKVFLSREGQFFDEVAADVGLVHDVDGLSVVRLDMDNDGDQDIAITAANERFSLFRNDIDGDATNWLRVVLDTSGSAGLAPMGFGSRVTVSTNGQEQLRALDGCANYLSSNEPSLHFGLGDVDVVDEVIVEWPDGSTTRATDVEANQTLVLVPDARS